MARLPYVDPETASPDVQKALGALPPINVFRMVAQADSAFKPFLKFGGAILTELELDPVLRELVILQVAKQTGAEYEWVQHVAIAKAVGASDEQIEAIERGEFGGLSEDIESLLEFTIQVIGSTRAEDETFATLREHFPPRQIVEAMLVIGQYSMLAKVMTHLDLELDEAVGAESLRVTAEELEE